MTQTPPKVDSKRKRRAESMLNSNLFLSYLQPFQLFQSEATIDFRVLPIMLSITIYLSFHFPSHFSPFLFVVLSEVHSSRAASYSSVSSPHITPYFFFRHYIPNNYLTNAASTAPGTHSRAPPCASACASCRSSTPPRRTPSTRSRLAPRTQGSRISAAALRRDSRGRRGAVRRGPCSSRSLSGTADTSTVWECRGPRHSPRTPGSRIVWHPSVGKERLWQRWLFFPEYWGVSITQDKTNE